MYVPGHFDNPDRVLERRTPDFLILGAAKAGTTALYTYLGQHPAIYLSPTRETNFFALEGQRPAFAGPGDDTAVNAHSITDWQAYTALFAAAATEQRAGECAPLYLYHPEAPERIHRRLPDARLVVLLRNPAERAYASYLHLVRDGRETVSSFEEALALERDRIAAGWEHLWHYREMGYYGAQLTRYGERFASERLHIVSYDRFSADTLRVVQEVFAFLGVDPAFAPDLSRRPNRSGVPRSRWLHRAFRSGPLRRAARVLVPASRKGAVERSFQQAMLRRPPMPVAVRANLLAGYRDDLRLLQASTGFDTEPWLDETGPRTNEA